MRLKYLQLCLLLPLLSAAQIVHNQFPIGSSFGAPGPASYDYVVIGGGTAGLTVATRLAQDGRYSVAVIEAGTFYELSNGNHSVIPGYYFYSLGRTPAGLNPLIDWNFTTTPQAGVAGNPSLAYARGKCLGGSSARNSMVYQRPPKGALNWWAAEVGDQSWSWESVFPLYKTSSHFWPPNPANGRLANATPTFDSNAFDNGPIQVSYPQYASPLGSWLLRAFQAAGSVLRTDGFESGSLLGNAYVPASVHGQTEERSSSQSYLDLALQITQLTVYVETTALEILFNGTVAIGVTVSAGELEYNITANKEVILSAGPFQSPQLLMVSGIGPKETLGNFGIPVVKDLPGVGQNMWDNPIYGISFPVVVETGSVFTNNPLRFAEAIEQYNTNRTGFLTTSGAEVINFEKVNSSQYNLSASTQQALSIFPSDWPEVQYWGFGAWFGPGSPPDTRNYGSFVTGLTAPLSRGSVSINSSSMLDKPIINPNWLTHPVDKELVIASIRRERQFLTTPPMQQILAGPEAWPGANVTSDADILAAIQVQAGTFYHASGTCKMGLANDSMAVVDSKARVFGVQNLRVVDLSAVPFLPPGQPQATVYMLAEKAAVEILAGSG